MSKSYEGLSCMFLNILNNNYLKEIIIIDFTFGMIRLYLISYQIAQFLKYHLLNYNYFNVFLLFVISNFNKRPFKKIN